MGGNLMAMTGKIMTGEKEGKRRENMLVTLPPIVMVCPVYLGAEWAKIA
jgi:hypothetical protein